MNRSAESSIDTSGAYLILFAALLFAVFPTFWILSTSVKTRMDIFAIPPKWIFEPTLEHFRIVLTDYPFVKFLFNSLVVSTSTTMVAIALGTPAAYGFARYAFRGSKDLSFWILSLRMAPPIAFILPLYLLISNLKLLDTQLALIVVDLTFALPIVVWIMIGFFQGIPRELEESALVDGSSRLGVFWRIVLPLSLPGLWTTAVISFIFCWNEFLYALILTGSNAMTLPVAISAFNTQRGILWGEMGAASVIAILPILTFATFVHRHFVKGLTLGAVKG